MDSWRGTFVLPLFLLLILPCPSYQRRPIQCHPMYYHRPTKVPQEVRQAMWNNDRYKIMSLIIEKKLTHLQLCGSLDWPNNTPPLTIFAPQDDAIRFDNQTSLYHQFVISKLEENNFANGSPYLGSEMKSCFNRNVTIGESSVDNVPVTDWNLYRGKGIIVHGVKDFFKIEPRDRFDEFYDHACTRWDRIH